jgi:hypothetical protein
MVVKLVDIFMELPKYKYINTEEIELLNPISLNCGLSVYQRLIEKSSGWWVVFKIIC